jgi:hypothetical protein
MLFKETVAVYRDSLTEPINKNADMFIGKAGATCSYHWALKG